MENITFSNSDRLLTLPEKNNVFLIDWLTFVAFGETVDFLKALLGLDSPSIPWEVEEKFRNGYPMQCYWNGITFSYGADDEKYYKDPSKARNDMGICVNLSGTGCRCFETYGNGDWFHLFSYLFRNTDYVAESQHIFKRYNITRLDLAYDDHNGILDINQIERDTRDRNYTSRSKYSEIVWSDNQNDDIHGLTIQIGSDKSDVKIRIYNKAAERGFKDRHWIRTELQLRSDRAKNAAAQLVLNKHIGRITSGILRNYLLFRTPSSDSNISRWPIADYWDSLILDMQRISLWAAPGEEYNFANTEYWLFKQYGAALSVISELHDPYYVCQQARKLYPVSDLPPKYQKYLADLDLNKPFAPTLGFAEAIDIFKEVDAHEEQHKESEYQDCFFN